MEDKHDDLEHYNCIEVALGFQESFKRLIVTRQEQTWDAVEYIPLNHLGYCLILSYYYQNRFSKS